MFDPRLLVLAQGGRELALQQVSSYLSYSSLGAHTFGKAAHDPLPTIPAEPAPASKLTIPVRESLEGGACIARQKLARDRIIGVPTNGAAQKIIV